MLEILTQVNALQADPLAMLEKLKTFFPSKEHDRQKVEPQQNPLDDLRKVLEVFGEGKELFKSELPPAAAAVVSGDGMTGWQALTSTIVQSLPSMLGSVASIITAAKAGVSAPVQAAAPASVRQGGFDPYQHPSAAREFVRQENAAAASAPPSGAQPQGPTVVPPPTASTGAQPAASPEQMDTGQVMGIEQQLAGLISGALSCLQRGIDGRQFADGLITMNSDLAYNGIVSQIQGATIPVVIALAKTLPGGIGEQVTAFEDQFAQFIEEFLEGPPDWGENEDEPEHSAPADGAANGRRSVPSRK